MKSNSFTSGSHGYFEEVRSVVLRLLLLVTFWLLSTSVSGQFSDPVALNNMGDLIGMEADQVFDMIEIEPGDYLFATDRGVVRYNHLGTSVYDNESGLPGVTILRLIRGTEGKVWALTMDNGAFYFKDNKWIIPPFNDSLISVIKSRVLYHVYERSDGQVFFSTYKTSKYQAYITSLNDSVVTPVVNPDMDGGNSLQAIHWFVNDTIAFSSVSGRLVRETYSREMLNPLSYSDTVSDLGGVRFDVFRLKGVYNTDDMVNGLHNCTAVLDRRHSIITYRDQVYLRSTEGSFTLQDELEVSGDILCVLVDGSTVYVCSEGSGIFIYHWNGSRLIRRSQILPMSMVAFIFKDSLGFFWVSLLNEGLFTFRSTDTELYRIPSSINNLALAKPYQMVGDRVYLAQLGDLHILQTTGTAELQKIRTFRYPKAEKEAYNRVFWQDHTLYSSSYEIDVSDTIPRVIYAEKSLTGKVSIFPLNTDSGSFRGKLNLNISSYNSNITHNGRVIAATKQASLSAVFEGGHLWHDSTIVLYSSEGLFIWDIHKDESPHPYLADHPALDMRVTHFEILENGWCITSLKNNGILMFNRDSVVHLLPSVQLQSREYTHFNSRGNTFYAACEKGLFIGRFDTDQQFRYRHVPLVLLGGIQSIKYVVANEDYLILHNDREILRIPYSTLDIPSGTPEISLSRLELNGNPAPLPETFRIPLERSQNSLRISFTSHDLTLDHSGLWAFRLSGNEQWNYNSSGVFEAYSLATGAYTLEVMVRNSEGIWSAEPICYNFRVREAIYKTNWFWFVASLPLLLFIAYNVRETVRRRRVERDLIESNMTSLKMQINPHFIFNAFNSIQYLINSRKNQTASEYLSRLAVLIRKTISRPDLHRVSLEEEIQYIREFLSIESLRLDHSFDFDIETDPDIDPKMCFIPPMLIQPILENAVWHGVSNLEEKGKVSIIIEPGEMTLIVHLRDNGHGFPREKWTKIVQGEELKGSLGLRNVLSRLELLSELHQKNYRLELTDEPEGTHFILTLPL